MVGQEIRAVNLNPFTRFVCVSLSVNLTGSRRTRGTSRGKGELFERKGKKRLRKGGVHTYIWF